MNRRFRDTCSNDCNSTDPKMMKVPPEVYRRSSIGFGLQQSLLQLQSQEKMSTFLIDHVLKVFDQTMSAALAKLSLRGDQSQPPAIVTFQAKSQTKHKFVNNSWVIHLEDVQLRSNQSLPMTLPKLVVFADSWSELPRTRLYSMKGPGQHPSGEKRKRVDVTEDQTFDAFVNKLLHVD